MMNDKDDDIGLEAYFAAQREAEVIASDDLLARIMADAEMQMVGAKNVVSVPQPGFLTSIWSAIGGWPAAGGMVTATLVGVWIGFSQPAGLNEVTERYLGLGTDSYLVDLLPAFGDDFAEG